MLMENLFKNNDILLYQNSCHTSCCVDDHHRGGGGELGEERRQFQLTNHCIT